MAVRTLLISAVGSLRHVPRQPAQTNTAVTRQRCKRGHEVTSTLPGCASSSPRLQKVTHTWRRGAAITTMPCPSAATAARPCCDLTWTTPRYCHSLRHRRRSCSTHTGSHTAGWAAAAAAACLWAASTAAQGALPAPCAAAGRATRQTRLAHQVAMNPPHAAAAGGGRRRQRTIAVAASALPTSP